MPKKKISRAKFELLFKDLMAALGRFGGLNVHTAQNMRNVLEDHFAVVETDSDEIECSPMGDGFAV